MKKLTNFAIAILILVIIPKFETLAQIYPQHQFGLNFSLISGVGLAWQFKPDNDYALKLIGGAYYIGEDASNDIDIYASVGLEFQRDIYDFANSHFYGFAAASYWLFEKRRPEVIEAEIEDITVTIIRENRIFTTGIGIGWEYEINRRAAVSIEAGIMAQFSEDNDDFGELFDRARDGDTQMIGPGGGVGIRFRL